MIAEKLTLAARPKSSLQPKIVTGQPAKEDRRLNIAGEDRRQLVAEAAYLRAEQRGFVPGQELDDWLAAEIEIDALLGDDDGRA